MNPTRHRLLALLADGEQHSGARLAAGLGVSRTAVWKFVAELRERGVAVDSIDRRGYRLPKLIELMDAGRMRAAAVAAGWALAAELEVLFEVDSTNEYLYAAPAPAPGQPRLVFAELQHAGRGRRGRTWVAPFGSGLTFSIGWTFGDLPADLSSLSLVAGTQVVLGLRRLGLEHARLKWPNDIVYGQRKLGGLLTQLRSEAGGPAYVVIGLGLNLDLSQDHRVAIDSNGAAPACDLREALGGFLPGRNQIAASVAAAMLDGLGRFAEEGFAPFAATWQSLDSLRDQPVRILQGEKSAEGVARGIDPDGALRVERNGAIERFFSGDVSVRPATAGGPP